MKKMKTNSKQRESKMRVKTKKKTKWKNKIKIAKRHKQTKILKKSCTSPRAPYISMLLKKNVSFSAVLQIGVFLIRRLYHTDCLFFVTAEFEENSNGFCCLMILLSSCRELLLIWILYNQDLKFTTCFRDCIFQMWFQ